MTTDPNAERHDDLVETTLAQLREALAILEAIDAGDLLSELPRDSDAARRHQCAVSLLATLRRDLEGIACGLASAQFVAKAMAQLGRPARLG
jgi:hypothetical protein